MTSLSKRHFGAALVLTAGLLLAPAALAFDTGGGEGGGSGGNSGGGTSHSEAPAVPTLASARAAVSAKDWSTAVALLKEIVGADGSNADAYNLLGYSYRNLGKYDLAGRAYVRALKLDPRHTGALEYQGVLFIKLGQPDKARDNLARIKVICGTSCEEYKDLAEALG